ncbi:ROK family protein [Gardnerella pickettii JCP7659]|uniref:ROK family protein n=1 Tax=Gardnerella pickettii TaxID=2914924 RepID=UPI0003541215|nr:ROK family protein [Gardnerella pickettii]EPI54163.1 ROK family protein [Gardnerella pickettii JCP7659]
MDEVKDYRSTYLAFDIGGTKIAYGLVTLPEPLESSGSSVGKESADCASPTVEDYGSMPTEAAKGGEDIKNRLVARAKQILEDAAKSGKKISGIGIAAAGVPNSKTGEIVAATDILPGWRGQRIYDAFKRVTDLPVYMIGDVGGHGLGEAIYGAGRGKSIVFSVGIGTGIGGAIIVNGKLFTGAHGVAGHAGHVVSDLGVGFDCSCGAHAGHIEPVASGTGLATLYNSNLPQGTEPAKNGYEVCVRANSGQDAHAKETLVRSGKALGQCVAGMANLIDPDVIVLSGSVVEAGDIWWNAMRSGFEDSALTLIKSTPIVKGKLGGAAPLIGAAWAVHSNRV